MSTDPFIDDNDARPQTVEQILEEWEAERPAIEADMERRQQQIAAAETLQWARQRNAARETKTSQRRDVPADALGRPLGDPRYQLDPETINKAYPAPPRAAVTPGSLSKAAARELLRSMRPVTPEKLAELPVELQKAIERALLPASELALMDAVAQILGNVAEKLHGRIDELEARLERIEAADKIDAPRTGLRAV